jgi:hypothetical protein
MLWLQSSTIGSNEHVDTHEAKFRFVSLFSDSQPYHEVA